MAVYAVDVGGSRIKLGLVEQGRVLARAAIDARSAEGFAAALPRISEVLRSLTSEPVSGIAVAFPSLVHKGRIIGDVGKFEDAESLDLRSWAMDEFGAPLVLENDARMAAIGEWQLGSAKGSDDVVMVTLGTGIGTGVIQGGRVMRGSHGSAGILGGHMTAKVSGESCPCGNEGCWETLASNAALQRSGLPDYAVVFASPDPELVEIKQRSLAVWGALAVSLIHAYDPEVLVFGGGVLASGEDVLGPIRQTVERRAWTPWGTPRIIASKLGDDAALLAAEWLLEADK